MAEQHRETVEEQGVKAVLLEIGEGHVELIEPLSAGVRRGEVHRALRRGHAPRRLPDRRHRLGSGTVREAGLRLIDEEPRPASAAAAWRSCTQATGGVLTELVEPAH